MDFHRASKLKSSETTKYQRLPSPMTYITNYNKVCSEENEQTKQCLPIDKKHNTLFLWNDGYVQLNRIRVPNIMEVRKNKRKTFQQNTISQSNMPTIAHQTNTSQTLMNTYGKESQQKLQNTQSYSEDENQELWRNQKQIKEKLQEEEMQKRTDKLVKVMQENNAKQIRIQKDRENVMLIDNNQRKYFSHTKQQMLELQNHILGSQKISREIMDRKGLSLRKVLSSIPQDKLMQIIDYKQFHFQKIMNEKILPKKEFRLKSVLSPKFTGEHNYDFNRTTSSKFFNTTAHTFMPGTNQANNPSQQQHTRNRTSQKLSSFDHQRLNHPDLQNQFFDQPPLKKGSSQLDRKGSNVIGKKDNLMLEKKGSLMLAKKGSLLMEQRDNLQINKQLSRGQLSSKNKKNQDQFFDYFIDNYGEEEGDNNQDQLQQNKADKKKELRIKSTNEVSSTIQKLNEIQEQSQRIQKNEQNYLNIPPELLNEMMSITYKPKTSLDKMLQHDDETERQLFIQSLENTQKHNEKKNFFNYSNYFYGKYSKQNNGLSTKLSQNAIHENEKFQQDIQLLINEIDLDHQKIV